jgi:hypothetical protein
MRQHCGLGCILEIQPAVVFVQGRHHGIGHADQAVMVDSGNGDAPVEGI